MNNFLVAIEAHPAASWCLGFLAWLIVDTICDAVQSKRGKE